MYLAWQHNPQCEFHCAEGGIRYGALLGLGGTSAAVVAGIAVVIGGLLPACIRGLVALLSKQRRAQQAVQGSTSPPSAGPRP